MSLLLNQKIQLGEEEYSAMKLNILLLIAFLAYGSMPAVGADAKRDTASSSRWTSKSVNFRDK